MNHSLIPDELLPIAEKIENRQRISEQDALTLYKSNDLNALGIMASAVTRAQERQLRHLHSQSLHQLFQHLHSFLPVLRFCGEKRDAHAFEHAIDEIVRVVDEALRLGITEVHMVGGLHPTLKGDWYLELLRRVRALNPALHIKAFTAIEVRHLSQRIFRMPIRETLELLRETGLGSITGGGAEIFDAGVRDQIKNLGAATVMEPRPVSRSNSSVSRIGTPKNALGQVTDSMAVKALMWKTG